VAPHTLEKSRLIVDVLIPALNEEATIGPVVTGVRVCGQPVRHVVLVDNGSTDKTAFIAEQHGALVVREPERGYGAACLRGLRFIEQQKVPPDVVVFMDADGSDNPGDLGRLLDAILAGADLAIGSRTLGLAEPGSLAPAQRVGNAVAVNLIRAVYGQKYTDLGPFRAVRYPALLALGMTDTDYGWTVEMQVKAVQRGLRIVEVPVRYHRRLLDSGLASLAGRYGFRLDSAANNRKRSTAFTRVVLGRFFRLQMRNML
jgi:glycosyltransferase involved in cell wall biosynthesis